MMSDVGVALWLGTFNFLLLLAVFCVCVGSKLVCGGFKTCLVNTGGRSTAEEAQRREAARLQRILAHVQRGEQAIRGFLNCVSIERH